MNKDLHPISGPHFAGTQIFVSDDGELYGEDTPESREMVRRIEACVNACEGISTAELENNIIQDMRLALNSIVPLLEEKKIQIEQEIRTPPAADVKTKKASA